MDYSKFPSMITKSSELVLGLVYFHVYGHMIGEEPRQEEIIREPFAGDGLCSKYEFFEYRSNKINRARRACGDNGLDGANYNHNRMFKELNDANAFIQACKDEGIQRALDTSSYDY